MLTIENTAYDTMVKDAIVTFPDECCGFFYGLEEGGEKKVTEVLVINNAEEGDKRRRFEITPKDYLKAERLADEKSLQLLGVYHSHPNHPAIPSEHDRVAAQPYFSYIILSIVEKECKDIRSWVLNNDQQFEEEVIHTNEILTANDKQ